MTLGYKIGLWVAIGVASVSATVLTYQHYSGLVDSKVALSAKVATLQEDVAREHARAEAFNLSLQSWGRAAEAQALALEENTTAQRQASANARELKNVLSKHDLEKLAKSKPGLIKRRVNDGSSRALRLLERSTETAASVRAEAAAPAPAAPTRAD